MKICSLLPSATEILYALGAGGDLVGVSEKCVFPPEARHKTVVVRARIDGALSPREIDTQVNEMVARGESLYRIDAEVLDRLRCDLIVTQELCHVCAASPHDLGHILGQLSVRPAVVSLNPRRLADVWNDIRRLGQAAGRTEPAEKLAGELERQTRELAAAAASPDRPRVLCLEWLDPPFIAGHWIPDMVALAGGTDVLGQPGEPGFRLDWPAILASQPETIVLMPCGYHLDDVVRKYAHVHLPPGWAELPAVRAGKVFAVDANACFSGHGPRLIDGLGSLCQILAAETTERGRIAARPQSRPWARLAGPEAA